MLVEIDTYKIDQIKSKKKILLRLHLYIFFIFLKKIQLYKT
jgi:hypothetical protein